jgi:hypothetical protein
MLRAKQKEQVDRIKKQTKYDETRNLLEKYTDEPPATPVQGTPMQARRMPRHSAAGLMQTPVQASPRGHAPTQSLGSLPHQRGWVDKIADALLGENEQSPASMYALICAKCHTHNGLVLRDELATTREFFVESFQRNALTCDVTEYKCPKCGHFNPPKQVPTSLLAQPEAKPQLQHKLSNSFSTPNFRSKDLQLAPASNLRNNIEDSSTEDMSIDEVQLQDIPSPSTSNVEKVRRRKSSKKSDTAGDEAEDSS